MLTESGNSNPTNPTYPTNPTNPTNPTTINSGELTDKNPKSKPEIEFQYAAVRFSKPEVLLSQPWSKLSHQNLACK